MKRSDLYALAWAEPIVRIAARVGLSDRGLAKICERNHIPLPPRGYWAKVAADKYPPRAPLPRPDQDCEIPLRETAAPNTDTTAAPLKAPGNQLMETLGLVQLNKVKPVARTETRKTTSRSVRQQATVPPAPADPCEIYAALDIECDRVIAAGLEFQRRQAAEAFLAALVGHAPHVDPNTAQTILTWARAVGQRLERKDPVDSLIQSIRETAESQRKPLWWPKD